MAAAVALVATREAPTPTATEATDPRATPATFQEAYNNRKKLGQNILEKLMDVLDACPRGDLIAVGTRLEALAAQGVELSPEVIGGLLINQCKAICLPPQRARRRVAAPWRPWRLPPHQRVRPQLSK